MLPQNVADTMAVVARDTVLRPVIAIQRGSVDRAARLDDATRLRAERDSLAAVLVGSAHLESENRNLRDLLGVADRLPYEFVPVELLHMHARHVRGEFTITAGREDGVRPDSPIVSSQGLVGIVRTVGARGSIGIDWSHHDFRASAMTLDGETYGMVEPFGGRGRGAQLLLTATPFHTELEEGTLLVTSGRAVFPRGVPIGRVVGAHEAEGGWQRSYIIEPAATPGQMGQVLVLGEPTEEAFGQDLAAAWGVRPDRMEASDEPEDPLPPVAQPPEQRAAEPRPSPPTVTPPPTAEVAPAPETGVETEPEPEPEPEPRPRPRPRILGEPAPPDDREE